VFEYWKVGIAGNPVSETELNIHQLAHHFNILDDKLIDMDHETYCQGIRIEQLEDENQMLKDSVANLMRRMDKMENADEE
jgi:hypothetical protein